jgi:hypothetical protein
MASTIRRFSRRGARRRRASRPRDQRSFEIGHGQRRACSRREVRIYEGELGADLFVHDHLGFWLKSRTPCHTQTNAKRGIHTSAEPCGFAGRCRYRTSGLARAAGLRRSASTYEGRMRARTHHQRRARRPHRSRRHGGDLGCRLGSIRDPTDRRLPEAGWLRANRRRPLALPTERARAHLERARSRWRARARGPAGSPRSVRRGGTGRARRASGTCWTDR